MRQRAARAAAIAVAPSRIHGRGLFAARRFRKGEVIGELEGPATDREGPHVLWVEDEDGGWEGRRATNDLRFVNHADEPNAEFDGWTLVALGTIRPGDEITVHYGDEAP